MKKLLAITIALMLALFPGVASAAEGDDDVLVRVNSDVTVTEGETVDVLVVVNGNATVEGSTSVVFVVNGNATVSGSIGEHVTVINGTLDLQDGAQVRDVNLVNSDLQRDSGATVSGSVNEEAQIDWGAGLGGLAAVFSIWFWVSTTLLLIVAALIFAAIGGRQLTDAAFAMTGEVAYSILGAVVLWVAMPVVIVALFATIVGIPLAIVGIFWLATLWALGFIVAGTRLGGAITRLRRDNEVVHPYAAAAVGVLLLQLVTLVPVLGWFVASIGGLWGSGALMVIAYRAMRRGGATPATPMAAPQA